MWGLIIVQYKIIFTYGAKRKEDEANILPFASSTWKDVESTMVNGISQLNKDKNGMISIICGP